MQTIIIIIFIIGIFLLIASYIGIILKFEELKIRVDHLNKNFNKPHIIETRGNLQTLEVIYSARQGEYVPMGVVKHQLATQLAEKVADNMYIDIDDNNGCPEFKAYIKIAVNQYES